MAGEKKTKTPTPTPSPTVGGIVPNNGSASISGALGGLGLSPAEVAQITAAMAAARTAATTKKTTKPGTMVYPAVSSDTDANAKITSAFQALLDRDPTAEELATWRPKLQKAQKANAATQKYTRSGDIGTQASVTGLNETQWLKEKLSALPKYQEEIKKAALTPKNLAQKATDKKLYMDAVAEAKGDPKKIAALDQGTNYGIDIAGIKARIKSAADAAGASYDEADLLNWAQEAYDTNKDQDAALLNQFITSKLKFAGAGFKGKALDTFAALRDTATANGMDINKMFGAQLPEWIKAVNDGANVEEFKQRIRNVAKLGLPEKVSSLLDQGIDLEAIYTPYRRQMANLLEVNEDSIGLDDPLLRSAIGPDKEMSLYDFKKVVRKDPRWQYTDNAREEVSTAALGILRDFGFQG